MSLPLSAPSPHPPQSPPTIHGPANLCCARQSAPLSANHRQPSVCCRQLEPPPPPPRANHSNPDFACTLHQLQMGAYVAVVGAPPLDPPCASSTLTLLLGGSMSVVHTSFIVCSHRQLVGWLARAALPTVPSALWSACAAAYLVTNSGMCSCTSIILTSSWPSGGPTRTNSVTSLRCSR